MVDVEKQSYFVVGMKHAEKSTARVLSMVYVHEGQRVAAVMVMMMFSHE